MRTPILALGLLLSACGPGPARLALPPAPPGEAVAVGFASVEVLDVSLPSYAEEDDILVRGPDGALVATGAVWADDPVRAVTLELASALGAITGARAAPEPWPFPEDAEARLDVRVSEIVADAAVASFVMRGEYFVGAFDDSGRDRARPFLIRVPLPPEPGPVAIAAARGQAVAALARAVATDGLR